MTRCLRLLRIAPIDGVVPVCVCVCVCVSAQLISQRNVQSNCSRKRKSSGEKISTQISNFLKKNLKSLRQLCRTTIQWLKCFHMSIHTIVGFQSAPSCAAAQQMALASGAHFLPTERCAVGQKKKRKRRRRRRRERERNEMGHCVVVVRALLMAWLHSNHRSLLLCSRRNLSAKETTKQQKKKEKTRIASHLFLWPRVG